MCLTGQVARLKQGPLDRQRQPGKEAATAQEKRPGVSLQGMEPSHQAVQLQRTVSDTGDAQERNVSQQAPSFEEKKYK